MLKNYNELRNINVSNFCKDREVKDENGRKKSLKYLPWAKCLDLLHDYGAESVNWKLVYNGASPLFCTEKKFESSKGRENQGYFIRIEVNIDDKTYIQDYPLMNGSFTVYSDTMSQLRINNAMMRAFVKCVAINTGLGLDLWLDEDDINKADEDLSIHNILRIRERFTRLLTSKMENGLTVEDIAQKVGLNEEELRNYIKQYGLLDKLEKAIRRI